MRQLLEIENIEELRCQEGIDDAELRQEVRRLRVGDHVKLTILTGQKPFGRELVLVRITSIKGTALRGKLAGKAACAELLHLHVGSLLAFTTDHIHSIARAPRLDGDT